MSFRFVRLALLCGALALAGCASLERAGPQGPSPVVAPPTPSRDLSSYPRSAEAASTPATLRLMQQARTQLDAGQADKAVASLEMALNIEPRNPFVWEALAQAHLARQLPEEAEHVAVRSNSFAHGNPFIEVENWRTIQQARSQRGDVSGAQEAADRVAQLNQRIAD